LAWNNKTKNAVASSTSKTKILQQSDALEIRTPDNNSILVGSAEDLVLIFREGFNNWNLKTKIEA